MASQLRKLEVEVSVKNLSPDSLRQLDQAKQTETRHNLQNDVLEVLKGREKIRSDKLMGMPWVVTAKHFPGKKVKARLVVLEYQDRDLEDELLDAATPTPTRRATHCFLKVATHLRFELRRLMCREHSCRDKNKELTGMWFQRTNLPTRWESSEENQ